jgi:hypothetical protein
MEYGRTATRMEVIQFMVIRLETNGRQQQSQGMIISDSQL